MRGTTVMRVAAAVLLLATACTALRTSEAADPSTRTGTAAIRTGKLATPGDSGAGAAGAPGTSLPAPPKGGAIVLPALAELTADVDGDGDVDTLVAMKEPEKIGLAIRYGGPAAGGGQAERVLLSPSAIPGRDVQEVRLHGAHDLTGDGGPEIIWSVVGMAAHSPPTYVFVTTWVQGRPAIIPGDLVMPNLRAIEVDGRDLLLRGGIISSVGAGPGQRERTDRFRIAGTALRLVDRRFEPSPYAYHRLQDGIVAESFDRPEDARTAYAEAMDPNRPVGPGLHVPEILAQEGEDPARVVAAFPVAVQAFARFRLGLLLLRQGDREAASGVLRAAGGPYAGLAAALLEAQDPDAGCRAAARWAAANADFLKVLNSPWGYAAPRWSPEDLCGALPLAG